VDELLHLPRDSRVNGLGTRVPVRLDIPNLPRHALIRAQESLNALRNRCGCVAGGVVTLGTLVAGAALVWRGHYPGIWLPTLRDALLTLTGSFIAGLLAKLAVLLVTRWQFAFRCRNHHRWLSRGRHVHLHAMGR
jgi:hypothetical protein